MRSYKISSRYISALLLLAMILSMVPAAQIGTNAMEYGNYSVVSKAHGMSLTSKDYITMPMKIMDFESDGMMFDYLFGRGATQTAKDFRPETDAWIDYTGTLTASTPEKGTSAGGRGIYMGSAISSVSFATTAGNHDYDGDGVAEPCLTISQSSKGGKQLLNIVNTKATETGMPVQWQLINLKQASTTSTYRYMTIVFQGMAYDLEDPKIGISTKLSEDPAVRYADGNFSGWYHLDTDGRINTVGDRCVDTIVIDLSAIKGSFTKLYIDFPMNTKPDANGNLVGAQDFKLIGVGMFSYEGDAHQFGYWSASLGAASDTDTFPDTAGNLAGTTVPKDSYDNNNDGFSFFVNSTGTFGNVNSISGWLAGADTVDGVKVPRASAGSQPLFISKTKYLWKDSAPAYPNTAGNTPAFAWKNNATSVNIAEAIGYTLFETIGDTQSAGYATVGLLESSLDEDGLPVYKESVLNYMQIFLRNRFRDCYEYELDGWKNYSAIAGAPNGDLYGYADGGQVDHDPNKAGIQGVPMDFATALAQQLNIERRAQDVDSNRRMASVGTYAATMAKREYLKGSWMECKQYVKTWWDAAYYILANLWVPNSYNNLQSDYNYLNLYKSTNTNSDSYGNYVFDSALTTVNASPYTSAVTYNKDTKTIGLAGATYKAYFGSYEAYNPFVPVHHGEGNKGESTNLYYLDDGVNTYSAFGGNLVYEKQNYGYTMACNGEFTFENDLMFHFDGDDDVYLFINGELVMDLGGTHNNTAATIYLDDYVDWAQDILANRANESAADVARAEKLNLKNGETYSFDFFYMERHGTGANLRIETNIQVVVPELEVDKMAWQDGNEVPNNGVVDNTRPVEYGFSLTNDGDTSKLYNISFIDSQDIGVKLTPENGLEVLFNNQTRDKNGGVLDPTDLVAYVDGYNGDPSRPNTKKLETITVTFNNNEELKQFLKNLSSDDGTDITETAGLYSGDGLWAYATVTIRGFYYTQTFNEQGAESFTNTVRATATNGAYKLSGEAKHTVFKFGEPAYFQWAGHELIIDSEKLYTDLKNAKSDYALPALGHMELSLTDASGAPMSYDHVSLNPGGDVYLRVNFPTGGMYFFYLTIRDKSGQVDSITAAVVMYVVEVKDSAVVLDYGLNADLSTGNGLYSKDICSFANVETVNRVMAITGVDAAAGYVQEDVSGLFTKPNTENGLSAVAGTNADSDSCGFVGKFDTPIFLNHDTRWVIEWQTDGSLDSCLLLSQEDTGGTANNRYIFVKNDSAAGGDLISMGVRYEGKYQNYGVSLNNYKDSNGKTLDLSDAHTYRLMNMVNTDSSNDVWLFVDGKKIAKLETYWDGGTNKNTTSNWISGKDFSFKYMGAGGHEIDRMGSLVYLRAWEEGPTMNNYRWELDGTTSNLAPVASEEIGSNTIDLTYHNATSSTDTDGHYYSMDSRVILTHDKEWVIEYAYSGLDLEGHPDNEWTDDDSKYSDEEVMIFASHATKYKEGDVPYFQYLYMRADNGLVAFGRRDAAGFHNYGIDIKGFYDQNFDTSAKHTYRLENRVFADGTNKIYLYVDGNEVGALDYYYKSGVYTGPNNGALVGDDLTFLSIGHDQSQWPIDGTLHYLQVWEDTSLTVNYGWEFRNGVFADASVRDVNGNRIDFAEDADGKMTTEEGEYVLDDGLLTFKPNKFMEGGKNDLKIAFTVHDRNFTPTPLADKTVDIANEVQVYKNITIIPATVVYYEDDFPAISYVGTENIDFTPVGSSDSLMQGADADQNYGSDDAYNDATVNISAESVTKIAIDDNGPLAYFDFAGSGFEIVARTNATDSGVLFIEVYKQSDLVISGGKPVFDSTTKMVALKDGASAVRMIPVITEFDHNDNLGAEEMYQIPVIRVDDLPAGEKYTAIIFGVPDVVYDESSNSWVTAEEPSYLYLDGIRIFQPIGATNEGYSDVENGAQFVELRNEILAGNVAVGEYDDGSTVIGAGLSTWTENHLGLSTVGDRVFVGNNVNSVNDYLLLGPNNEVYMDGTFTNAAIVMLVKENPAAKVHELQLAIRAIDYGQFMGAGHTYELANIVVAYDAGDGDYHWKELATVNSGTEQYYTVPYDQCPMVGEYYLVAVQVQSALADVPAMASFSSVKYNGLELGSVGRVAAHGVGNLSSNQALSVIGDQLMTTSVVHMNESKPVIFDKVDTPAQGVPVLIPESATLSFEDQVYYNIYFSMENFPEGAVRELGLAVFDSKNSAGTVADASAVCVGATFNGGLYAVQTDGIPAKMLGDTLYFKVYAKMADGSYVYSALREYSAKLYAMNRLNNSEDPLEKAMMVALLNYGAAAQNYFGYKTGSLANSDLSEAQLALVDTYRSDMIGDLMRVDPAKTIGFAAFEDGFSGKKPSVSMEGAFAINYYFTAQYPANEMTLYYWTEDSYLAADVLCADNATGALTMIHCGGNLYKAAINGIAAKDMDSTILVAGVYEVNGVTYSTGVLPYSLGMYCKSFASETADVATDLAAATAVYGYYAENYFGN